MFLTDYHLHSKYSFDGHHTIDEICEKAIKMGLKEIAITDHMDIYSDKPYGYILDCQALFNDIAACQKKYAGRLKLRKGIEYGQPMVNPKEGQRFLSEHQDLDVIIGSVHNMEHDIDVADYDFTKLDAKEVYDHYLDYLLVFAEQYDFDVLGHITYPLRYMAQAGRTIEIDGFTEKIKKIYKLIIDREKGIEINVSGYRQALKDAMPCAQLVKLYKACGGRILTIGSDAHYIKDVGADIWRGQKIAHECGFEQLTVFEKRVPAFINF